MVNRRDSARAMIILGLLLVASLSWILVVPRGASAFTVHSPIYIPNNANFTAANGVTGGNGTAGNPYIIEGWDITASTATGIDIRGTTAYFIVRNVYVHGGRLTSHYGFYLYNVVHGRIQNSTIDNNYYGIYQWLGGTTSIVNSNINNSFWAGLYSLSTSYVNISSSRFYANYYGIYLSSTTSTNITGTNVSSSSTFGIYSYLTSNMRVNGSSFYNDFYGIYAYFATSPRIMGSNVTYNQYSGIYLYYTTGATIQANRFLRDGVRLYGTSAIYFNSHTITTDNLVGGKPIYYYKNCISPVIDGVAAGQVIIASCTAPRVANLTLDSSDQGIQLGFVTGGSLNANRVTNQRSYGIVLYYSNGVNITGNNASSNLDTGVSLQNSNSAALRGNIITRNTWYGVSAFGGTSLVVSGNNVSNNYYGIYLSGSAPASVNNNTVYGNSFYGILVSGSAGSSIRDNNASRNYYGVYISSSNSAVVASNKLFQNTWYAIYSWFSTGNVFDRNNMTGSYYGIYLDRATNPKVTNSTAFRNTYGAYVWTNTGALIHHNNFIANTYQAFDNNGPQNAWNLTYPGGGNYWSNYTGVDLCSGVSQTTCTGPDGMGDTNFIINGNTKDRYPLMRQQGVWDTAPIAYFTLSFPYVATGTNLTVDASRSWDQETSPTGLQVRWDWNGDGVWDTGWSYAKTATHQWATPGVYNIRVQVMDPGGLTNTTYRQVGVALSTLHAAIGVKSIPTTLAPLTLSFTGVLTGGAGPYTYTWDFGDGGTGTGVSPSHTYSKAGNYTVTLTVTDATGQTTRVSTMVTASGSTTPPPPAALDQGNGLVTMGLIVVAGIAGALGGLLVGRRKRPPQIIVDQPGSGPAAPGEGGFAPPTPPSPPEPGP